MTLLLVFAVTLVIAVLVSSIARSSVLSAAVLFLVAGFLAGRGLFGAVPEVGRTLLERLSEVALASILFTDGMRTGGLHNILRSPWLPGRALLIGMPLTIVGIALLARLLLGIGWTPAFLVAAVLSPTDPVFIAAAFRWEGISDRLKALLNIESGLNDGLALPVVLLLLAFMHPGEAHAGRIVVELVSGIGIGVVIPWLGIRLEQSRFFKAVGLFEALNAFALGLLVLAICYRTGANLFLGAFSAGITIASLGQAARESFERFGELLSEIFKLAAVLIFGAMIAPRLFLPLSASDYVFIALAVFATRPPAVVLSLLGTDLTWHERELVGWFGPKGFASVVYGLMILQAGFFRLAHLVALGVAASILVYSSTDILVGRWFSDTRPAQDGELPN